MRIEWAEPEAAAGERQIYLLQEPHVTEESPFQGTRVPVIGSAGPPDLR